MKERVTEEELFQIVAEVEKLANTRMAELDRQQVKDILFELHLPVELLDDAMVQMSRRQALAAQQKQRFWISTAIVVSLLVSIGSTYLFFNNKQQAIDHISVYQHRLTLMQDDGNNLTNIERLSLGEVFYRVTLQSAPVGEKLSLQCDWIDPNGQIAHQNKYQTQVINQQVWPTYCRHQLDSSAPLGTWEVRMYLGDRLLSSGAFVVR